MGLDLYIEARIREKQTGRVISADPYEECVDEDDKGFFEICWWCSRAFFDIRSEMIRISNRYAGTGYTDSDFAIPVPQAALHDIYAYLVKRSCLHDEEHFEALPCETEWEERFSYEKANLLNADKLHDLLFILDSIKYSNAFWTDHIIKDCIPGTGDLMSLKTDPQAYEWEFRIFNSY